MNEIGSQEIGADEENGCLRPFESLFDLFIPIVPHFDVGVIPPIDSALSFERLEMDLEALDPLLVLVAIADK